MPGIQIIQFSILPINYFLWAIISLYFIIIIAAWFGWQKTEISNAKHIAKSIYVSVIVAARNEDKNLPVLLADLRNQTYPISMTEWIIVDDHSVNKILGLKDFESLLYENLVIIELETGEIGKKAALRVGSEQSKGELLIFTDADCCLKPHWIESIVAQYVMNKNAMIIGLVNYHDRKGFLHRFYSFDLMSLVITGAGLASIGLPVMCNGANLAVRKDIYLKNMALVRPEIVSGDDIFMLHSIKNNKKEKLMVLKLKEAVVTTNSPSTLNEFLNQRRRWASKSWLYTDKNTVFLALIVLLANLAIIGGFVNAIFTGIFSSLIYLFLIKATADCFIITAGLNFFGEVKWILLFPVFSVFYPFYILYIFVLSSVGVYSWKGRIVKN
jgi:poly-beta-1,6-N-acetyl-D-glucosamine synthase